MSQKPVAVYYEHPEWFKPLFAELDRPNISYKEPLDTQYELEQAIGAQQTHRLSSAAIPA